MAPKRWKCFSRPSPGPTIKWIRPKRVQKGQELYPNRYVSAADQIDCSKAYCITNALLLWSIDYHHPSGTKQDNLRWIKFVMTYPHPLWPCRAPSLSFFLPFLFSVLGLFVFSSFSLSVFVSFSLCLCLSLLILVHLSSLNIVQILLKSFDMLLIDGTHLLKISITL